MNSTGSPWIYDSLEDIALSIEDPSVMAVSFDVFDTLIERPLAHPEDLFILMEDSFAKLTDTFVSFKTLRMDAEAVLRRRIISGNIDREDVTLDEIYHVLSGEMGVSPDVAAEMKKLEFDLELKFCIPRDSGRMLYERAAASGKRIVVITDMYLNSDQIREILEKNGYCNIEDIFVSSDYGKRKITGNLYDTAAKVLELMPGQIFHIGDNEEADCRIAAEHGFATAWLPSSLAVYEQYGCAHQVEKICAELTDREAAEHSPGIGCMRALAAIKYFDDPFRKFEKTSDYNADPYFVGYAALGMELLAVIRWLSDNLCRDGVKKIIFMARDGYLPMKAYEIYRKIHPDLPPSAYLHVSRLSVLPAMIKSAQDLFDLPVDISYQTPEKLSKLLLFCTKDGCGKDYAGLCPDEAFTRETFQIFIEDFIYKKYDAEKHAKAVSLISDYMRYNPEAAVSDDCALFDMGYSGRIPAAIISSSGTHPRIYYFHSDPADHFRYENRTGMKIRTFFDFSPYMESSVREYSYLEPEASCIAYTENGEPVYDSGPAEGYCDTVVEMQRGALDFISDYLDFFADYERAVGFRNHDAAMPFEAFIRYCSPYDRRMYEKVMMDDELWGGRRDINIRELMEIRNRKLPDYAREYITDGK